MDTGASAHIFANKSHFSSFDSDFQPNSVRIILADGTECDGITAKGEVTLTLNSNTGAKKQVTFKNVYLLPNLNHAGIISVKSSIKQGHAYNFNSDFSCVIIDKVKCPLSSKDDSDLFYLDVDLDTVQINTTIARPAADWHAIMGHLNFDDLLKMESKVEGMTITSKKQRICNPCILNKTKWKVSKKPAVKGSSPMESIHADISMPPGYSGDSYNNFKYIVNFVDDHSGYMYCIPLVHKSDVIEAFQKFLLYSRKLGDVKT